MYNFLKNAELEKMSNAEIDKLIEDLELEKSFLENEEIFYENQIFNIINAGLEELDHEADELAPEADQFFTHYP